MRICALASVIGLLLAQPAWAQGKPWEFEVGAPTIVQPVPISARPRSVALVRVLIDMPTGREWAALTQDMINKSTMTWEGGRSEAKTADFEGEMTEELSAAGFKTAKSSLFAEGSDADLQVGAIISDLGARLCGGCGMTVPSANYRGAVRMSVEWQVFSPLERKVVFTLKTTGAFESKQNRPGVNSIFDGAFRENVRQLLNAPEFRRLALEGYASPPAAAFSPLNLSFPPAQPRSIPSAVTSVVAVFSNGGMGSAFLISQDGYLLTNQHVVGDSRFVKIKWADGSEGLSEVVRADSRRDVALLKTEPKGHQPLSLRRDAAATGETVYAIGTPLDEKYQNTLTKGIVSGSRILDGSSYVQSDVAIDHGNSGGPLLDDKGQVIALAVMRDERDGVGHGINFFIPIEDALKALGVTTVVEAPTAPAKAVQKAPARRRPA